MGSVSECRWLALYLRVLQTCYNSETIPVPFRTVDLPDRVPPMSAKPIKLQTDDNAATLHAMFPTLVYHASLPDAEQLNAAFAEVQSDHAFEPKVRGDARYNAGEYHGKILLHQSETLQPFFAALADHVARYLGVLGMRAELFDMQCLKSWFVFCDPLSEESDDDAIVPHNHSCSDISWVYYVDIPSESGAVQFHGSNPPATAMFESAFHYDWHNEQKSAIRSVNWWNSDTWSVHPKSGDLLIFPGHQVHSVEANRASARRITVAGDLALALRPEYRNLEFGRTSPEHWRRYSLGGNICD